jgi:hypothetical protein
MGLMGPMGPMGPMKPNKIATPSISSSRVTRHVSRLLSESVAKLLHPRPVDAEIGVAKAGG